MKKTAARLLLLAALAAVLPAVSSAQKAQKPKLPENYKRWLEEEVVYIIAPMEREVFLKLQSDRERELFIEAFWKQRDPTPSTPENEFKTEHYRRIAHATRYLGREAPRPGWKTDRGRMYIILGEPMETQRFESRSEVYECEAWFYQGKTEMGLPAGFYLLFFKPSGTGEFKLYSPVRDGPQALIPGYFGDQSDYLKAYNQLRDSVPALASIAMSLVPGEDSGVYGRPSLSSDLLIQRIETAPARAIQDKYARKFLEYKDIVEVEYTANYLDSDSLIKVFRDPSGLWFVHYAIEPKRLSVNQYESKYYTTLKVNGRVTTPEGRLVHQYDKTVTLELNEAQMADASHAPFDFHDLFPLVPGDYRLSVLVKNEASKEFTSVEQAIRVPEGGGRVEMTQPVLGYRAVRLEPAQRRMKAFRLGPFQLYCQPNRVFSAKETLAVAFQLNNVPAEAAAGGEVKISFAKDGQPFREIKRKPAEYADLPFVLEEISLADFPPAHYTVNISLSSGGAEIVSAGDEFDVSFAQVVPRPWLSTRILPDPSDPYYAEAVGGQLFNLGRASEARVLLESAFQKKPESPSTAAQLARTYLTLGENVLAARILAPFVAEEKTPDYGIFLLAGRAFRQSGDPAGAVGVFDRAVSHFGVNAVLLNEIGGCYADLGKPAEALASYEKSLQLSPDQPEIRKIVDEIRKKR